MNDYDLIVIGGGGAGLSAAIMARQAGASVMVLESATRCGGATAQSAAVMYAAGTSVQRAAGIMNDSADAMYYYLMTLASWQANPRVMRTLSDHSGPALEWLISLGVQFPVNYLLCSGVEDTPRGHPSLGVADALINAAGAAGAEIAVNTRVEKLLVENGRVVGVRAGGMDLRGGAVIIATGGIGNNKELLKRFYPTAYSHGDWTYAVHFKAPSVTGDGVIMGEQIGANIVGHDTGLLLPTTGLGKFVEAFMPPWIILVNEEGKRFMDETAPYAVSGYLCNAQTNRHGFAVFDSVGLEEGSQDMRFADPYQTGSAMPTWEYGMLHSAVADGRILKADTLDELAGKLGISAKALANTVVRYNADCDKGCDRDFFKEADRFFPIRKGPFYAREVRACIIGQSGAGLDINEDAQVLDTQGSVIPGLYAAGETVGVAMGQRYSGGGMGICNAIVYGRIAGQKAAAAVLAAKH
jgi:fumarate reductase flavoprotein subunit